MPKRLDDIRIKHIERGPESESRSERRVERIEEPEEVIAPRYTRSRDAREESRQETREEIRQERRVERERGPKKRRYGVWLVAIASVLFLFFALSYSLAKVTVTVNPKVKEVNINENLTAVRGEPGSDDPSFDLIVLSGEATKNVQATEEKDVLTKATGKVVIYNNFSEKTQLLSIDTRLEGSNGKIYKTKKQVVVPGMTGKTPGSLEVDIYASAGGPEYNSDPLDFKIFGFKGTPKYDKFYARSTGPITGGNSGKAPVLTDEEKTKITDEIKNTLKNSLVKKAASQIPKGFIMFKDAAVLDITGEDSQPSTSGTDMFALKEKGTLYGILFDEKKLTKKIAKDNLKDYQGEDVFISNIRDLNFAMPLLAGLSGVNKSFLSETKKIDFSLSGKAKIVWKLDESKLVGELLGRSKADFKNILLGFPNINSADLVVSPFWKGTLPDKSKDIKIDVKY